MSELSKERLDELERLARDIEADYSPTNEHWEWAHESCHAMTRAVSPCVLLALVAAARGRDAALDTVRAMDKRVFEALDERDGLRLRHTAAVDELGDARSMLSASEKERDELRAKVEALREQLPEIDDLAFERGYAKGREDERRDVVAWMRRDADSCECSVRRLTVIDADYAAAILRIAAQTIEDGEHEPDVIERGEHVAERDGE